MKESKPIVSSDEHQDDETRRAVEPMAGLAALLGHYRKQKPSDTSGPALAGPRWYQVLAQVSRERDVRSILVEDEERVALEEGIEETFGIDGERLDEFLSATGLDASDLGARLVEVKRGRLADLERSVMRAWINHRLVLDRKTGSPLDSLFSSAHDLTEPTASRCPECSRLVSTFFPDRPWKGWAL